MLPSPWTCHPVRVSLLGSGFRATRGTVAMTKKNQTTPEHFMLWGRVSLPRLTQYDFDSVKESWTNTNMAHTESQRHLIF